MNTKIYNEVVQAKDGLDTILKKCFLTHLTIYNHSLELLKDNPQMNYAELREHVFRYVEENKVQNLHIQAVQNEIYYLHKKFKRDRQFGQKLLSSIQYLTLILKDFNNGITTLDATRTQLRFHDRPGYLELPKPLPQVQAGETTLYVNLSYSSMENQFQLSIFEQVRSGVAV
jgi:hypothetical protein